MTKDRIFKMVVLAGPSGSGKTTLCKYLLKKFRELTFSVSATTRSQRKGESDGKDYYFLTKEKFEKKIKNKQFLEYEEVYNGRLYGTLKEEIIRIRDEAKIPVLDVDVNGALRIKNSEFGEETLFVFVHPVNSETLRKRLIDRGTEDLNAIEERLKRSNTELKKSIKFDYILYNDDLEKAQKELETVIQKYINQKPLKIK